MYVGSASGVEGRRERGHGLREVGRHRVEPGDRVGVGLVDALVGAVVVHRVGDEQDGALVVVEHREVGGEQHGELGQVQVVLGEVRQPLEPAHGVVAEVADQAAGERRQAGVRVPAVCSALDVRAQHLERVAVGRHAGRRRAEPDRAARPAR